MSSYSASARYPARRRRNAIWLGLSVAAAAIGLIGLVMILVVCFGRESGGFPLPFSQKIRPRQAAPAVFSMRSSEA